MILPSSVELYDAEKDLKSKLGIPQGVEPFSKLDEMISEAFSEEEISAARAETTQNREERLRSFVYEIEKLT